VLSVKYKTLALRRTAAAMGSAELENNHFRRRTMAGPTVQQLKSDIDNGKTGDKNAEGFDLGFSTLGTDDEAAGTPNTAQQIAEARKLERARPRQPAEQSAMLPTPGYPAVWTVVGAFAAVVITMALAAISGR